MSKTKTALLVFAFFAILAVDTAFHPFDHWDIQSGPLLIFNSIIETVLVSWLGDTLSGALLGLLAIIVPLMVLGSGRQPAPARTAPQAAARPATPRPQTRQTFGKR